MRLTTLDYHTAGEPLRIVTGGLPGIPGDTMLAKRRFMREELDAYRKILMHEPRGHADMYGAVLTEPTTPDGDVGVLFMHNEGYSTMCGHGIIAMVTAGLQHRLFDMEDRQSIRIDTPAGRITARADLDASNGVRSVTFRNVPSFVLHDRAEVLIDGTKVTVTVAYGGAFYAYVDAGPLGLDLVPAEAGRLIDLGRRIKQTVSDRMEIRHPAGGEDLDFLYGTIFVRCEETVTRSRNVCIFADGELDRSPTGTGVSGRAAIHFARGEIGLEDELRVESIIGTAFRVRCVNVVEIGGIPAVIPEVTGSAHISGEHTFIVDDADPVPTGFFIR